MLWLPFAYGQFQRAFFIILQPRRVRLLRSVWSHSPTASVLTVCAIKPTSGSAAGGTMSVSNARDS